ncbi:hypothetical protein BT96DRAFT_949717 [Gymnopus androsaceus JB14]|uniref:Uncharacterized protein n=1 Tax=Gymnopus androsaceus JB14 TaxID=1447944 RepID=A0A6A4GJZ9_9AGAR|nr:hypothetical protein BT96DRAFT_949717 [Gymnopus androsaceus JB14]
MHGLNNQLDAFSNEETSYTVQTSPNHGRSRDRHITSVGTTQSIVTISKWTIQFSKPEAFYTIHHLERPHSLGTDHGLHSKISRNSPEISSLALEFLDCTTVFEKISRAREDSRASIEPEGIPESTRPSLRVRIIWDIMSSLPIDAQAFSSIDWDDAIHAYTFGFSAVLARIVQKILPNKDDRLTRIVISWLAFSGVTRDEMLKFRSILSRGLDSIPLVDSARKRMHETMKHVAHEVHDLLIPFHHWQCDNPRDDYWRED